MWPIVLYIIYYIWSRSLYLEIRYSYDTICFDNDIVFKFIAFMEMYLYLKG